MSGGIELSNIIEASMRFTLRTGAIHGAFAACVALSTRGEARARDYEDEVETVEDARSRLLDRAESVERSLDELVDRARTAYDDMQPELAMSALEYAIKLGLSIEYRGRKLGQVYLLQGLVIHASKQTEDYEEQTRSAFIRALSYDRDIRLSYQDSVPRLEQIFDAAIQTVALGEVCEIPTPSSRFEGHVTHVPKRRVDAGREYSVRITLSRLLKANLGAVTLFYRTQATRTTRRIAMKSDGETGFAATIPGEHLRGNVLNYYVLIDDPEGTRIAQFKTARAPARVTVEDLASGATLDSRDSAPVADKSEEAEEDDAVSLDSEVEAEGASERDAGVSVVLGMGTGFGRVTTQAEPVLRPKTTAVAPGMALSPFHLELGADYSPHERLRLGAFARVQVVDFTHLEGLRAGYRVAGGASSGGWLRGGLGYGHVSHQVPSGSTRDYTLEGSFLYTLGASYEYTLSGRVTLYGGLDFLHLIGDSPSQHFDLGMGARLRF